MAKPSCVHFLGDIPGLGEDLLQKLIHQNVQCSIDIEWYEKIISSLSTELEFFVNKPVLYDDKLIQAQDIVVYFAFNRNEIDLFAFSKFPCEILVVTNHDSVLVSKQEKTRFVYVYDMILCTTITDASNDILDEYLSLCKSDDVNPKLVGDTKHWWVSQQDVAAGLARLLSNVTTLPSTSHLCGRRGWTKLETYQQLLLLYQRTIAGSSGNFKVTHLEQKPVINPVLEDISQINKSSRPDLSIINEALREIDGDGWRPLTPLRTSLMQYLATKDFDQSV